MFQKVYILGPIFVSIYFWAMWAGCNGSCETVDGQDWIVNLIRIWGRRYSHDDLNVNIGASLKLENVNISIKGKVNIYSTPNGFHQILVCCEKML